MSIQNHLGKFTKQCPVCRKPWHYDIAYLHGTKRMQISCKSGCLNHQSTCYTSSEVEQFEHLFTEYQRCAPARLLEKAITRVDDPFNELRSLDYIRRHGGLSWHGAKLDLIGGIPTKISPRGYRDRLEWTAVVVCREDGTVFKINADNPCSISISNSPYFAKSEIKPDRMLSTDECRALDINLDNPFNNIRRYGDKFYIG